MGEDIRCTVQTRDGEDLVVRRLRRGDGPALQRFNRNLGSRTRSMFLPHAFDDATVAAAIERSESDKDRVYVVLCGKEIVAYFFLWFFDQSCPSLGIGITDTFQGRGLGGQLIAILAEDARSMGRDSIDLTTMPTNERAFGLYKKMGFRYVHDVENLNGDGSVEIERWMFLPLNPDAVPHEHVHRAPV